VLNLDEYTWLKNLDNGSDFFISLTRVKQRGSTQDLDKVVPQKVDKPSQADGIISDIRHLVVGLSSRRGQRARRISCKKLKGYQQRLIAFLGAPLLIPQRRL
jgi:hypothetical protein